MFPPLYIEVFCLPAVVVISFLAFFIYIFLCPDLKTKLYSKQLLPFPRYCLPYRGMVVSFSFTSLYLLVPKRGNRLSNSGGISNKKHSQTKSFWANESERMRALKIVSHVWERETEIFHLWRHVSICCYVIRIGTYHSTNITHIYKFAQHVQIGNGIIQADEESCLKS